MKTESLTLVELVPGVFMDLGSYQRARLLLGLLLVTASLLLYDRSTAGGLHGLLPPVPLSQVALARRPPLPPRTEPLDADQEPLWFLQRFARERERPLAIYLGHWVQAPPGITLKALAVSPKLEEGTLFPDHVSVVEGVARSSAGIDQYRQGVASVLPGRELSLTLEPEGGDAGSLPFRISTYPAPEERP